jgi:1-acyl-sn-glycerol-3-phosphate acyltransferase
MRLSPTYNVIGALSTPVLRGIFRLRVDGLENVPASGGCVLASNHLSSFDPWPLGVPLWPRRQLRVMAKSELYWFPLSLVIRGAGAFPVRRGQRDTVAIETGVQLAREGHIVAMFPEGTRRHKGLVKRFEARPHSGAARIALEADVPLIPAAVKGTDRLLRLARLHVAYGTPVDLDDLRGQEVGAVAAEATERLMARIAALEASL